MAAAAQQSPAEQMAAYWRDWFAQMNAAGAAQQHAQQQQQAAAAMGQFGAPPFPWVQSPEAMRQMQAAFLDALAQQCDQYMRSPQFLDAMKRSMDQALEFRQRVDKFLKDSAASAFSAASGGAPEEIVGALRQIESRLTERLDDLGSRIERLEAGAGVAPKNAGPKPGGSAKGGAKGGARRSGAGG